MPDRKSRMGDKPRISTKLDEAEKRFAEAEESLQKSKDEIARSHKILGDTPKDKT
jgi:cellobiose-specific phosphotransferase system component IIA